MERKKLVILLRHHSLTTDAHAWMSYKEVVSVSGVKTKTIFSILDHWNKMLITLCHLWLRARGSLSLLCSRRSSWQTPGCSSRQPISQSNRGSLLMRKYGMPLVSERTLTRVNYKQCVRYRKASYYYNKKFSMERELSDRQQVMAAQMTHDMIDRASSTSMNRLSTCGPPLITFEWEETRTSLCRSTGDRASHAKQALTKQKAQCITISSLAATTPRSSSTSLQGSQSERE